MQPPVALDDAALAARRWARIYLLVVVLAVVVMALLWLLTVAFNVERLPA